MSLKEGRRVNYAPWRRLAWRSRGAKRPGWGGAGPGGAGRARVAVGCLEHLQTPAACSSLLQPADSPMHRPARSRLAILITNCDTSQPITRYRVRVPSCMA